MMGMSRAWIEIDRGALRHNVKVLQSLLPPGCALMPAVKANAYGHGAVLIARKCQEMGIHAFCAATLNEGIELRQNGIKGEILILGWTHSGQASLLHEYNLTQTVMSCAYARDLDSYNQFIQVHIKIDTGMHRLGIAWDRRSEIADIFHFPNLQVTGAYTHLCCDSLAEEQGRRFYAAVEGFPIPKLHLLASDGLLYHPELGGDYARMGIALYGATTACHGLRPVLSLKARVAQVRELPAGESLGYELQFTARRPSRIAALTIGYGDGLPRSLSCGVGNVLLHRQKSPVAGMICMDQTLVDVTDIPEVSVGDIAVLIGKTGTEEIRAVDMAVQAGTISNEILSCLGPRLDRIVV